MYIVLINYSTKKEVYKYRNITYIVLLNKGATITSQSIETAIAKIKNIVASLNTLSNIDAKIKNSLKFLTDIKLKLTNNYILKAYLDCSKLLKKLSNYTYFIVKVMTINFIFKKKKFFYYYST